MLLIITCFSVEWTVLPLVTGMIGSLVNIEILHQPFALMLLGLVAINSFMLDTNQMVAFACYLVKTMIGDAFAQKLDTFQWKLVGMFSIALTMCSYVQHGFPDPKFLLLVTTRQFGMEVFRTVSLFPSSLWNGTVLCRSVSFL